MSKHHSPGPVPAGNRPHAGTSFDSEDGDSAIPISKTTLDPDDTEGHRRKFRTEPAEDAVDDDTEGHRRKFH